MVGMPRDVDARSFLILDTYNLPVAGLKQRSSQESYWHSA